MEKRLSVLKTYKLYIDGKFPRTESGRYYQAKIGKESIANMCLASRKDFRNAVVAARKAQQGWQGRSAFNKSQILYRVAEMLEGRSAQFKDELMQMGHSSKSAEKEIEASIDRLVYYAGWCDKWTQVFGSVNPVASPHFNFSTYEPQGVVLGIAPEEHPLLGLVTTTAVIIAGGNAAILLSSESKPLAAITFAEVLHASDVPAGVVNILTGNLEELIEHFANHMDVNAILNCREAEKHQAKLEELSVCNLKRIVRLHPKDWYGEEVESPYHILNHAEVKTTWHPIEVIGAAGSGY